MWLTEAVDLKFQNKRGNCIHLGGILVVDWKKKFKSTEYFLRLHHQNSTIDIVIIRLFHLFIFSLPFYFNLSSFAYASILLLKSTETFSLGNDQRYFPKNKIHLLLQGIIAIVFEARFSLSIFLSEYLNESLNEYL